MSMSAMRKLFWEGPEEARRRILKALERAEGNRSQAAKALGVATSTIMRWIAALDMAGDVDALRPGRHRILY